MRTIRWGQYVNIWFEILKDLYKFSNISKGFLDFRIQTLQLTSRMNEDLIHCLIFWKYFFCSPIAHPFYEQKVNSSFFDVVMLAFKWFKMGWNENYLQIWIYATLVQRRNCTFCIRGSMSCHDETLTLTNTYRGYVNKTYLTVLVHEVGLTYSFLSVKLKWKLKSGDCFSAPGHHTQGLKKTFFPMKNEDFFLILRI